MRNPKGAGRKPVPDHLKRVNFPVRLPKNLVDKINNHELKNGELTEIAINKFFESEENSKK